MLYDYFIKNAKVEGLSHIAELGAELIFVRVNHDLVQKEDVLRVMYELYEVITKSRVTCKLYQSSTWVFQE